MTEVEERGKLIEQMLNKIYPLDDVMPQEVREGVETDRQMLVLRVSWGTMPIKELRSIANGKGG